MQVTADFKKAIIAFEKAEAELTIAKIRMIEMFGNKSVTEMGKVYNELAREQLGIENNVKELDKQYLFVQRLDDIR